MRVKGAPVATPPDTQHLGLLERTIIGVNNVYFDIAATLRDRFWSEHNTIDVINHAVAENYRLHGVLPPRGSGYLPEAWQTTVRQAVIVVVPPRPNRDRDGNPMFDQLATPPNKGDWVIETGLLAANKKLLGTSFDTGPDTAVLLVKCNSPGVSGEVAALLSVLGEWNRDRNAMMKAVRAVFKQAEGDLPLALAAMPDLKRFLPHEAYPLPTQRVLHEIEQVRVHQTMAHVDMGTYLPATVRLAKHDETTNATKGTPRG
jgi:hypothetical protein